VKKLSGELTPLGRATAAIPINPIHAKMLLFGGAFRCVKHAAVAAAFLAVKNPFQQHPGTKQGRNSGKDYFNKQFDSDHLTTIQAYYEWRLAFTEG
jgi:HrpA-like RNA helicase